MRYLYRIYMPAVFPVSDDGCSIGANLATERRAEWTTSPMECPKCNQPLKFTRWSKRLPKHSEALAVCPGGCGKFGVRYFRGQQTSEPYQIRQAYKTCRVSGRLSKERKAAIVAVWGSVQNYLDYSVVQIGMTQQYKQ